MKASVSVVVPVYNNAATLPELCRRVRAALPGRSVEIILVDDGSTDGSRPVIEGLDVRSVWHERNRGQNSAILSGLREATQPLACVLDADLEDPPEAIPRLLEPIEGGLARVVFASRDEARSVGSRFFRWAIHRLFPSLPPHPCLFFAIDEAGRRALVEASRPDDYLPAVIGALSLATLEVTVARGARPPVAGPGALGPMGRLHYGTTMLGASVRLRWRRSTRAGQA